MSLASDAVKTLREIELDAARDCASLESLQSQRVALAVQIYCALKANQSYSQSQQQQNSPYYYVPGVS